MIWQVILTCWGWHDRPQHNMNSERCSPKLHTHTVGDKGEQPTLVKKKKKKGAFAEALVRCPASVGCDPCFGNQNAHISIQDAVEDEQAEAAADVGDLALDLTKKKKKKKAKVRRRRTVHTTGMTTMHTGTCRGGVWHGRKRRAGRRGGGRRQHGQRPAMGRHRPRLHIRGAAWCGHTSRVA